MGHAEHEFSLVWFFMVEHFGLTILVVSDRFCKTQRSWGSEERCTAVLFESVMVIGVYAPDSGKDLWKCEKFTNDATLTSQVTSILSWGCCVQEMPMSTAPRNVRAPMLAELRSGTMWLQENPVGR